MMTNEDPVISAGVAAWSRVQDRARKSWGDWILIGRAVEIGRAHALQASGASTPHGTRYRKAMAAWLTEHRLAEISQQVRWRLLLCMDNLADIDAWRAGLQQEDLDRWSHPDSIWMHYCRAFRPGRQVEPRKTMMRPVVASVKCNSNGAVANPGQDMVRRVAVAIRENWTTDTFKLAATIIRAVLTDPDLISLLNEKPTSHSRRTAVPDNTDAALTAA